MRGADILVQVLGGILASCGITLMMFVTVLYLLFIHESGSGPALLWVGIMYTPCIAIGSLSFLRNMKAFGLTLVVVGLVSAILLCGAVNNFMTTGHHPTYYAF